MWDQSHWWSLIPDYSFGYLTPLLAAYVIYDRWPRILNYFASKEPEKSLRHESYISALVMTFAITTSVGGMVFLGFGALYRAVSGPAVLATMLHSLGFAAVFLSSVYLTSGTVSGKTIMARIRFTCLFIFPALIWIISAPLFSSIQTIISLFLQDKVTVVVVWVFEILALPLQQRGNVLVLPDGEVGVAEACSGIRSLMGCLFAGSFLAAVFLKSFWRKVLLVGFAMVLAFLMNLARSLLLTGIAYRSGEEALSHQIIIPLVGDIGNVHDVTGFGILFATVGALLLLLPFMEARPLQQYADNHEN